MKRPVVDQPGGLTHISLPWSFRLVLEYLTQQQDLSSSTNNLYMTSLALLLDHKPLGKHD